MSEDVNDLKEYVAFIIRESFKNSGVDIPMEDQTTWKIVLYRHARNFVPDTLSGYGVLLVTSYMDKLFDIAVPPDHLENKSVLRFLKELHELQDYMCIYNKPWEEDIE